MSWEDGFLLLLSSLMTLLDILLNKHNKRIMFYTFQLHGCVLQELLYDLDVFSSQVSSARETKLSFILPFYSSTCSRVIGSFNDS